MIPITNVQIMKASDAATIAAGTSGIELMARAGEGLYESLTWRGPVAIVCGSGNNAGDGYVLALELEKHGIECVLILLGERFSSDGEYYYAQCVERGIKSIFYTPEFSFAPYEEIVDCIFGTGFSGKVSGVARDVIEAINQSGKTVISADINSGLCGNCGLGTTFVKSDLTVSVGSYKTGHFLGLAKDAIKKLCNIDIGITLEREYAYLCEQTDFKDVLVPRAQHSHKGNYGYVTILGGCREYAGAVKLANMSAAALRAGCGVASLAVPEAIEYAVAPYLLESTLFPIPSDDTGHMRFDPELIERAVTGRAAIAVGMGWGSAPANAQILEYLLTHTARALIIDADGLNTLSQMDLRILKQATCRVVLTPHLKEFERLSKTPIAEIEKDPVTHAAAFAKEYGVCLLLKGCTTVITDGTHVYLVDRGCAGMATAGSGDVLSGILAGILGYADVSPLSVACGAYIAGRAGEIAEKRCNPVSMVASDTVAAIAEAISELL